MKNIELKVRVENFGELVRILKKKDARYEGVLRQADVYYNCENGRLKLREINNKRSELIFYSRPDKNGSKISEYQILKIEKKQLQGTKAILKAALGEKVIVRKKRELWLYEHTRIHLDIVNKLGKFLELETVVENINLRQAKKEHDDVIKFLGLGQFEKYNKSYSDLLS